MGNSVKSGTFVRWNDRDDKMFETAMWHISNSISNGKSTKLLCDTTEWLKGLRERLRSDNSPVRMREVLRLILNNHVGRDGIGQRVALFGEDVISMISEALSDHEKGTRALHKKLKKT